MKNLLSIITVVCLLTVLTVEVNSYSKASVEKSSVLSHNMNILSIKSDIDRNRRAYLMTGSFTVLKTPRNGRDVAHTTDISFRNARIFSRGNYIQANPQAIRNDNNSVNPFRIYVPHISQGKVDERNIKVNWRTGSLNVIDKLANVSVIYQKDSILIIGTMQKNGYTLGVSLAIAKETGIH